MRAIDARLWTSFQPAATPEPRDPGAPASGTASLQSPFRNRIGAPASGTASLQSSFRNRIGAPASGSHSARLARLWSLLAAIAILNLPVQGADKSGVGPNSISLPSGPGSIEGLGEAFQPALNTGTARHAIHLQLPPGTAGHAPPLTLGYEGGAGNGILGFGWSLPFGFVQRQSEQGVPRYVDDDNGIDDDRDGEVDENDERDVFINEQKEELVPQDSGFHFCKNEGSFIRYRFVRSAQPSLAPGHWEATLPTGTRLTFGITPGARIVDAESGRVFRWLIESSVDIHGNTILYTYRAFAGPQNHNQLYLDSIRYGPGAPPWQNFHFAAFSYEDRPDWFEDCRPGFVLRTGKRLKEIVIGTQGPELEGHLQGDFDNDGQPDHLVRRYRLGYLRYAGDSSHWSLLSSIQLLGADDTTSIPPATFDYAVCDPPDLLDASGLEIGGSNEPPFVVDNPLVDLVDLNGDGLPDLLKTEFAGGSHTAYFNLGEIVHNGRRAIRWSPPNEIASTDGLAWNVNLASTGDIAHLADMDGDGLADLAYTSAAGDTYYFANRGNGSWDRRENMSVQDFAPPAPFSAPDVRTADLDFDKRIDIVQSLPVGNSVQYRIWFNLGDQRYARSLTVSPDFALDLSQPGVDLADINGDRLPDLVRVQPSVITVAAGLGYGNFAPPVIVPIPDPGLEDSQIATTTLADLDGDGLADLVLERAEPGRLWYWLNLGNYTFSPCRIISGMPTALGLDPALRWADLNGNGTIDLIYADSQATPRLNTLDMGELLGCSPGHNVLTSIANGIGSITTIEYAPSTRFALEDAAAGQPWPDPMPFAISVVAAVTVSDSLGNEYLSRFKYHDGYYDGAQKEFRGFARAERIDLGDATAPTLIASSIFNTGRRHEALKGSLERLTTALEDGRIFEETTTAWTDPPRVLMTGVNGQQVVYAHPVSTTRRILELGRGQERVLEEELDFDAYGNPILHADYGITADGNRSAFDDERVTRTQYAINTNAWLLRFPCRLEISDEHGAVISRTETYYDDPAFTGTNFAQISRGTATLTRDWIDPAIPEASVNSSRVQYDAYGNAILALEPLAVAPGGALDPNHGHAREIQMDSRFHTYPEREVIHIGDGKPPLVVTAQYNEGLATAHSSSGFNGHVTTYRFDPLGRLLHIVRPGDSPQYPTAEYAYVIAHPIDDQRTINFVESRLLDKTPGTASNHRAHYHISRQFSDGLGRPLMLKQEAEPDPETAAPRVVVNDAVTFNARTTVRRTLNPFYTTVPGPDLDALLEFEDVLAPGWRGRFHLEDTLLDLDLESAHQTLTDYDAALRTVLVTHPDGASGRTVYEPLLTRNFDENDSDPASPFFNTPVVYGNDGLGRHILTQETTRLNDDGTPNRQLSTNDFFVWTTRLHYDLNDQLIRITDSQDNVKSMHYDGLRRLTRIEDPDRGVIRYRYDDASNLIESIDAKDQRITYTYDGANRTLTEDYHDAGLPFSHAHHFDPAQPVTPENRPDVAYFYDLPAQAVDQGDGSTANARNTASMLVSAWNLSGEEHTSYDERGRVEWIVQRVRDPGHGQLVAYRTAYTYDSADRLTRLTFPDHDQVEYQYNDRNLFERVLGGPTGAIVANFDYWPSELKQTITFGNGIRSTLGYDSRSRLRNLLTGRAPGLPASAQLLHYRYHLDAASNISSIEDLRPGSAVPEGDPRRNSQFFGYDDHHRLTRVRYSFHDPDHNPRNDGEIHYRYDRIGNLLAQTSDITHATNGRSLTQLGALASGGTEGAWGRIGGATAAPGPHALSQVQASDTDSRSYPYDLNGNMTEIDGLKLTWDFKDRLVAAENNLLLARYVYDHQNRRVIKSVSVVHSQNEPEEENPPPAESPAQSFTTLYIGRHFEIRDHAQPVKYIWVGTTRIARVTGSLSSSERIQRLRLHPGWNLVSLAVSSTDTASQLRRGTVPADSTIDFILRWQPDTREFIAVTGDDDLPAGTVLWIRSTSGDTVAIRGAYAEPSSIPVAEGGWFYPGSGLVAMPLHPPLLEQAAAWTFDPARQLWKVRLPDPPIQDPGFPPFLEPGSALFVHAQTPDLLPAPDPHSNILFYHPDHLGSSTHITNLEGESDTESAYYPFGGVRIETRLTARQSDYGFAQKEADRESGLQCFEARYLASALARFISADPLKLNSAPGNPQGLHPYAYTASNPLRRIDPTGLSLLDWAGDVAGGAYNYVAEKVDYVVENPGTTVLTVVGTAVTAPVTAGPLLIYGVGSTAYGAADSLIQAASGDDFSSEGYKKLDDKERREQLGRGIIQGVETGVQIAGAKTTTKTVVPKKNYSPAATHAKTQPVWVVEKTQPGWVVDKTQPGWVHGKTQPPRMTRAEANIQIQQHTNFILTHVRKQGGIVSARTYKSIERAADFWVGKIEHLLD